MNRTINPCPFCAGKGKLIKQEKTVFDFYGDTYYRHFICVQCKSCGSTGKKFEVSEHYCADEKAIEFWNKKARL